MKKITKIIAFAAMILLALCLTACGGPNGGENSNNDNTSIIRNKLICTYIQDSDNSNYLKFYEDGTAEYYSNGTLTYPRDQLNYTGSPTEVGSTIELRNFVGITLFTYTVNESNGNIFATQSMAGGFGSLRFSITIENAHTITVNSDINFGTIRVSRTSATAGTTIRITAIPTDDNAYLNSLTVDWQSVEVTASYASNVFTFTMPEHDVWIKAEFGYNYTAPTTVTLGEEGSGYIIYKATGGSFNFNGSGGGIVSWLSDAHYAAEHYFNEYENFVDDAVAAIDADLANKNQATQNYFQTWLNSIKAQAGNYDEWYNNNSRYGNRALDTIYDGSSFFLTDLIKNTPLVSGSNYGENVNRYVLCYLLEAVFNEQYKKGFGLNYERMSSRYSTKKQTAIRKLKGRSGLSEGTLINDIDDNNCAQVINLLNQKLSTALNYLNQAKGTDIDMNLIKKVINLVSSTQAVASLFDFRYGTTHNYALDSNMEDAITYVNTQSQNN